MRGILRQTLVLGTACLVMALVMAPVFAVAQSNSAIRPNTNPGVTTGVGSSSTFQNVPQSSNPSNSAASFSYLPEADRKPQDETEGNVSAEDTAKAPPPPAADVPENPRTMITRDRIESPQH